MARDGTAEPGGSSYRPAGPALSPRPPDENGAGGGNRDSTVTVLVAAGANLGVAAAKAAGGLLSSSAVMLSEAAHSFADTVTEVLLLTAVRRGDRPADDRHPFGYGKETYFWAFLAAVATFLVGAGFSITEGVQRIVTGGEAGDPLVSYAVLVAAAGLEGASLVRAIRQVRAAAADRQVPLRRYLRVSSDTPVKAVTFEDSAALVGLALAATGLLLEQFTGWSGWDGLASIAVGGLLIVVAVVLGRDNMTLLVGRAAPAEIEEAVHRELAGLPAIERIGVVYTMMLGPGRVLVAAKVDFRADASAEDIERAGEDAEKRLDTALTGRYEVFLDPTTIRRDGTGVA